MTDAPSPPKHSDFPRGPIGEAMFGDAYAKWRQRWYPDPGRKRRDFYRSPAWRALRFKVLAENARRNGGVARCDLCGRSRLEAGSALHADHIVPRSKDRSRELDPSNVQVMCADCNLGKSNRDRTDFRPPANK